MHIHLETGAILYPVGTATVIRELMRTTLVVALALIRGFETASKRVMEDDFLSLASLGNCHDFVQTGFDGVLYFGARLWLEVGDRACIRVGKGTEGEGKRDEQ